VFIGRRFGTPVGSIFWVDDNGLKEGSQKYSETSDYKHKTSCNIPKNKVWAVAVMSMRTSEKLKFTDVSNKLVASSSG
jgi:hypothetical protein